MVEVGFQKSSGTNNDKTVSGINGNDMYEWMTNDECVKEGEKDVYKISDNNGTYKFKIKKEQKHQGYIQYSIIK